jgi:hypothetical protein
LLATIAAVAVVAVAVAARLTGGPGQSHPISSQRISDAADASQLSADAICQTSGPNGTWTITSGGVAVLAPPAATGLPSQSCTDITLPDPAQQSEIQKCAATLQAAQQQIAQEASDVLFDSFMENFIQNNASQWASALTAQGDQGPAAPASSEQVTEAINQVATTNINLANDIQQALIALLNNSFEAPLDCSEGSDGEPNWYTNAFQAMADDQSEADLVNQALNAVAGQVAQWAMEGVSPDGTVSSGNSLSQ